MSALPDPLTPADCDLRGMPFMPVDIVRLFDSDLFALSTGDEFKVAFTLWGKAFLQVPAGSVPDDDRILAHLSGAGSRWSKLRDMALRGWIKCSDGRLYHPVVSEKARDAWQGRIAMRARTEAARAARAAKRSDSDSGYTPPVADNVTTSVTEDVTGSKRKGEIEGQGQGQGQDREEGRKQEVASQASPARPTRGSRLPSDWFPEADEAGYAHSLGLDPDVVAENFRDYWHGKAGKDATKMDWSATWRGWCRRDAERKPANRTAPSKIQWWLDDMTKGARQ